jgi:hypothetical protein
MDFGWALLHAADDEFTAVESVDQGFSGSGPLSRRAPVPIAENRFQARTLPNGVL